MLPVCQRAWITPQKPRSRIQRVKPGSRGTSGRVTQIQFVTDQGTFTETGTAIRSAMPYINTSGVPTLLPSTLFVIERLTNSSGVAVTLGAGTSLHATNTGTVNLAGADLQAHDRVDLTRLRGDHDDQAILRLRVFLDRAADLDTVHAGQHHVQDDGIIVVHVCVGEAGIAVGEVHAVSVQRAFGGLADAATSELGLPDEEPVDRSACADQPGTPDGAWVAPQAEPEKATEQEVDVWIGGPVEPERSWILLSDATLDEKAIRVCDGIYLSTSARVLEGDLDRARALVPYDITDATFADDGYVLRLRQEQDAQFLAIGADRDRHQAAQPEHARSRLHGHQRLELGGEDHVDEEHREPHREGERGEGAAHLLVLATDVGAHAVRRRQPDERRADRADRLVEVVAPRVRCRRRSPSSTP